MQHSSCMFQAARNYLPYHKWVWQPSRVSSLVLATDPCSRQDHSQHPLEQSKTVSCCKIYSICHVINLMRLFQGWASELCQTEWDGVTVPYYWVCATGPPLCLICRGSESIIAPAGGCSELKVKFNVPNRPFSISCKIKDTSLTQAVAIHAFCLEGTWFDPWCFGQVGITRQSTNLLMVEGSTAHSHGAHCARKASWPVWMPCFNLKH